ncbi:MAG: hypothetical protein KF705_09670 [Phycisphaeraceae bacterium]|nr:hypothetical protein [Phycisphaeraceae bacterium]
MAESARLCERWGVVAITDEVYERLVYRERAAARSDGDAAGDGGSDADALRASASRSA